MKHVKFIAFVLLLFFFNSFNSSAQSPITGAWSKLDSSSTVTLLFQDGYFSYTNYDVTNKVFNYTMGGSYNLTGNQLLLKYFFHSSDKEMIGVEIKLSISNTKDSLNVTGKGKTETYKRIDDGKSALAGHWLITGRMNNGNMQTITPGARRTIKLLTGTRFQWIAINSETKEFFGTGGGTYTFVNGKYTEHIEFFSRDSTRVGASLSFDGKVDGNNWHHSGLSSKGEPINEVWTRGLKL
jgi:hypothetical protein